MATDDGNNAASKRKSSSVILSEMMPLISSDPSSAIGPLQKLQVSLRSNNMFSSNEDIDEVHTHLLPLLAVDYHLSIALLNDPNASRSSQRRKDVLERAKYSLFGFLRKMETLGVFRLVASSEAVDANGDALLKTYYQLLQSDDDFDGDNDEVRVQSRMSAGAMREQKIMNFQIKRRIEEAIQRLSKSLNGDDDDENDDMEETQRNMYILLLIQYIMDALDQIQQGHKELEMLTMAVAFELQREESARHRGNDSQNGHGRNHPQDTASSYHMNGRSRAAPPDKPMEVTRVTQDVTTGQLMFKREQLQTQVFRQGWNQPTMSLAELGEIERQQAIERGEKQKEVEASAKFKPRRYEQLVRDGMEDDIDLVDASAKLDRDWDKFKDENPRGCGNKMADRGDRNF